jgi:hypothetical protein
MFCTGCGLSRGTFSSSDSDVSPKTGAPMQDLEFIDFVIEAIEGVDVEFANGEDDILARRLVIEYPEGTLLSFCDGEGWYLSHKSQELTEELPGQYSAIEKFAKSTYSADANGWELSFSDSTSLIGLIKHFDTELGYGDFGLPFVTLAESVVDDGLDEYLEIYGDGEDEDDDASDTEQRFENLTKISNLDFFTERNVRDVGTSGLIPKFSHYGRFHNFLDILQERYEWAVDFDECCGSCLSGTLKDIEADRGTGEFSIFITWSQNSSAYWGTNGRISMPFNTKNQDELDQIREAASETGLQVDLLPEIVVGQAYVNIS